MGFLAPPNVQAKGLRVSSCSSGVLGLTLCLIFTDHWVSWPLMSEAVASMVFSLADGKPYLTWCPLGLPWTPLSSGKKLPLVVHFTTHVTATSPGYNDLLLGLQHRFGNDECHPSLSPCSSAKFTLIWLYSRSVKMI